MENKMEHLNSYFKNNAVLQKRLQTDEQFLNVGGRFSFEEPVARVYNFVQQAQLLRPELWARFVEQFAERSDSVDGGWRGEYWGKTMCAGAFVYSCTKNQTLKKVLTQTVVALLATADENGCISTYTPETQLTGWDVWGRKYVLQGLQYFLEISTDEKLNRQIIAAMQKQADYLIARVGKGENQVPINETTNWYRGLASSSILEPMVRLYDLTGNPKYLNFATYIVSEGGCSVANVFELALADITDPYQYPVPKAYELISCFEGLLEYYRATGVEKYKTAVVNFVRRLAKTDITVIGSAGCTHEFLDHAAARQTEPTNLGLMQETCVTVTWMKLCLQMQLLTGDPFFADCFEKSYYNAYLGAVNFQDNINFSVKEKFKNAVLEPLPFDSYSPLLNGARGREIGGFKLFPDGHYYGCCACFGGIGVGMLHQMAATLTKNGVVLNLFLPGSITVQTPAGQTATLKVQTNYPKTGSVKIVLTLAKAETFALSVRNPAFSQKTAVLYNGEPLPVQNGYITINKSFQTGDTVLLNFDMQTYAVWPNPVARDLVFTDHKWRMNYVAGKVVLASKNAGDFVALRRGPVVFARERQTGGALDNPVQIKTNNNGAVLAQVAPEPKNTQQCLQILGEQGSFSVIDYASAGQHWGTLCDCWLPINNREVGKEDIE